MQKCLHRTVVVLLVNAWCNTDNASTEHKRSPFWWRGDQPRLQVFSSIYTRYYQIGSKMYKMNLKLPITTKEVWPKSMEQFSQMRDGVLPYITLSCIYHQLDKVYDRHYSIHYSRVYITNSLSRGCLNQRISLLQ